jgi:hypothetical protein
VGDIPKSKVCTKVVPTNQCEFVWVDPKELYKKKDTILTSKDGEQQQMLVVTIREGNVLDHSIR